jgi:hypothetical protein
VRFRASVVHKGSRLTTFIASQTAVPIPILHEVRPELGRPCSRARWLTFACRSRSGLVFFLPMCIQIGVSMLLSIIIFPSSASVAFLGSVSAVLAPLEESVRLIADLFDLAGEGEASLNEWIDAGKRIKELRVKSSTTGLVAMKGLEGSLGMDISWGRVGARDLERLGGKAKDVNLRAGGRACPPLTARRGID